MDVLTLLNVKAKNFQTNYIIPSLGKLIFLRNKNGNIHIQDMKQVQPEYS